MDLTIGEVRFADRRRQIPGTAEGMADGSNRSGSRNIILKNSMTVRVKAGEDGRTRRRSLLCRTGTCWAE